MMIRRKPKNGECGQVLILCAFFLLVLLLFVGLAIDFGFAYVSKASLGKAVDAAALSGAKSLYQGQPQATLVAQSAFAMNYGTSGRDSKAPVVDVTYSPDGTLITVQATASINTFFIRLLPSMQTLSVGALAQATRAHVMMTLVLDRSGSMASNGGGDALPPAVNSFVSHFDDTLDSVAMVSFATTASLDLAMQTGGFKKEIAKETKKMMKKSDFNGHTFSDGGLQLAEIQNRTTPPPGNILKVVVFFTDGYANTIQNDLLCTGGALSNSASVTWNFGGVDVKDGPQVYFMDPGTGKDAACHINGETNNCCTATFPAASQGGSQMTIDQTNVKTEAEFRAIADANTMRSENTIVYSIGLGNDLNKDFLYQIANDPRSSKYDSTKLAGEAALAPSGADLQRVFDQLASKILLRMTQ